MARGGQICRPKFKPKTPSSISLLRTKNGLDDGVHFRPHEYWEKKIAPRVAKCIVEDLRRVRPELVPQTRNKIAAIKDFHSLAPLAQVKGLAMGKLKGQVNPGYYAQVEEAADEFRDLARELVNRMGVKIKT
jgi:hypothetical protein